MGMGGTKGQFVDTVTFGGAEKIGLTNWKKPATAASAAPPPAADPYAAFRIELARQARERELRQGKGRAPAMSANPVKPGLGR